MHIILLITGLMDTQRLHTLVSRQLTGEASETELAELFALLQQDAESGRIYTSLIAFWQTENQPDDEVLEATYLLHQQRMELAGAGVPGNYSSADSMDETRPVFTRRRNWLIAAAFAAICLSVFLLAQKNAAFPLQNAQAGTPQKMEVHTQFGNRTKLLLSDGTQVWVNSGSKILYDKDFNKETREIQLEGEAYFIVTKDSSRPFIIHTAKMDVRVLGTQFNVKAYEHAKTVETSLVSGSITVTLKKNDKKYTLVPNQKLLLFTTDDAVKNWKQGKKIVADSAGVVIDDLNLQDPELQKPEIGWTRNILSFEDESFEDVAAKMERWYNVSFQFKNEKRRLQYLSGAFENETIEEALAALKITTGFNYRVSGKSVLIY